MVRLDVITLGQVCVLVDGRAVEYQAWRCYLARLMFFIAVDRSPLRRDEIGVCLWPDMSPRQVKTNFHAVRWRMNKALGYDKLYRWDPGTELYSFDPGRVEIAYDAAEFEAAVVKARALSRRSKDGGDTSAALSASLAAWREAIDLYGGDYLAGVDEEWALQKQRKLRLMYVEALAITAELYVARNELNDAIVLYQRIVEEDEYDEDAGRRLMQLLFRQH